MAVGVASPLPPACVSESGILVAGFGAEDLWLGFWGLGFKVWGLGLGFRVCGLRFPRHSPPHLFQSLAFRVWGFRLRV